MNQHGISMTAMHKFLDDSRAYLSLACKSRQVPLNERRSAVRVLAASVIALREFQKTGSRENAPA